jgi:thioredoxin-like negative regulator of GroEL
MSALLYHNACVIANQRLGAGESVNFEWLVAEVRKSLDASEEDARKVVQQVFDSRDPEKSSAVRAQMEAALSVVAR